MVPKWRLACNENQSFNFMLVAHFLETIWYIVPCVINFNFLYELIRDYWRSHGLVTIDAAIERALK